MLDEILGLIFGALGNIGDEVTKKAESNYKQVERMNRKNYKNMTDEQKERYLDKMDEYSEQLDSAREITENFKELSNQFRGE